MELFDNFFSNEGGLEILSRFGHVLAGITWIGILYFFNFVQTPAFAELSDGARSEALRKITSRALWWFRWAAALTFATGLLILMVVFTGDPAPTFGDYFGSSVGISIAWGAILATTMFLNVWLIIWPNQKIVLGSAEAVVAGGQADPTAAAAAKKGARASRTNTLFSIPMVWFMVFTSHFAGLYGGGGTLIPWVIFLAFWIVFQLSALGYIGGLDGPLAKATLDKYQNTIITGFAAWFVLWFVGFELLIGN